MPFTRTHTRASVTMTPENTATVNKSRVSKTEIKLATVKEMLAEAPILFEEHYEEIARNKQIMKLKDERRHQMEESNRILYSQLGRMMF